MTVEMAQKEPDQDPSTPEITSGASDGAIGFSGVATLFQAGIVLIGLALIWYGVTLPTDSAVHQIYQLNAITSGIVLIAIIGVWAAVDATRRAIERLHRKP